MEPTNQPTPQTPAADAGAGAGQPPAGAPAPQNGDTTAQPAATPAPAPANPDQGTGQTPGGIRNNPDGNNDAQPGANVNYQEKFGESTRENQRLMELVRQNGIDPKTGQRVQPQGTPAPAAPADPTQQPSNPQSYNDDQLAQAIPGFNALNQAEKDVIRYAKNTAKTIADLQRTVAEIYDERTTNQQIDKFKADPNYKVIAENEKRFREFAYEPDNLNLDIEHVALKFMQGMTAGTIQPTQPANGEQPQPTQPGMEGGSGGAGQINGGGGDIREMTAAEAANLRKTDHREYNRLAKEGKIKLVTR